MSCIDLIGIYQMAPNKVSREYALKSKKQKYVYV